MIVRAAQSKQPCLGVIWGVGLDARRLGIYRVLVNFVIYAQQKEFGGEPGQMVMHAISGHEEVALAL